MLDQKDTEGSQGHSQATVKPEVRFKESVGIGETQIAGASLLAQLVKNLPALQETRVRACKDPLEKGMTPTPVFLPAKFHGLGSLEGYSPWGRKELDVTNTCVVQTVDDQRGSLLSCQHGSEAASGLGRARMKGRRPGHPRVCLSARRIWRLVKMTDGRQAAAGDWRRDMTEARASK